MKRLHRPCFFLSSLFSLAIMTTRLDANPPGMGLLSATLGESTFSASDVEVWESATGELAGASTVENPAFIDSSVRVVAQPTNELAGADFTLSNQALDTEVLFNRRSGGTEFDVINEHNVVPGLSMDNFLVGVRKSGGGGGLPIGALVKYVPAVLMGLFVLAGLGSLVLLIRRRFHTLPPVHTIHFGHR